MKWARTTPLEKMNPVLWTVAQRLNASRKKNAGFTPRSIFKSCLSIGGVFSAFEVIISVTDKTGKPIGIALKKRTEDDHGWTGKYHVPGVVVRKGDNHHQLLDRLVSEIYGPTKEKNDSRHVRATIDRAQVFRKLSTASSVGMAVYSIKERAASATGILMELVIRQEAVDHFHGEWKVFSQKQFGSHQIIDFHRKVLVWYMKRNRPWFIWTSL